MTLADCNIQKESIIDLVLRLSGGGFVGGEADVNGSIYYFWERLKQYNSAAEEHKTDVAYYFGQSWHFEIKGQWMLFKIKITISKNLNKDWRQNIEQALKLIKQCAPGLMFEWKIGDKSTIFGANSIYVTTNIMINYNL